MQFRKNLIDSKRPPSAPFAGLPWGMSWGRTCAGLAFIAAFSCVAQDSRTGGAFRPEKADLPSPINALPDANAQMESHEKQGKQQKFDAANSERKKQIADESTKLL